jgi:hypothetical protein
MQFGTVCILQMTSIHFHDEIEADDSILWLMMIYGLLNDDDTLFYIDILPVTCKWKWLQ